MNKKIKSLLGAIAVVIGGFGSVSINVESASARPGNGTSEPTFLMSTAGQPLIAVYEGRNESFAIGCEDFARLWSGIDSYNFPSNHFYQKLQENPVAADLHCNGTASAYSLTDEGPAMLLIQHRDGEYYRHYINDGGFISALQAGDTIRQNGKLFRQMYPQRGVDLRSVK